VAKPSASKQRIHVAALFFQLIAQMNTVCRLRQIAVIHRCHKTDGSICFHKTDINAILYSANRTARKKQGHWSSL
jgi:hypothetical protein